MRHAARAHVVRTTVAEVSRVVLIDFPARASLSDGPIAPMRTLPQRTDVGSRLRCTSNKHERDHCYD